MTDLVSGLILEILSNKLSRTVDIDEISGAQCHGDYTSFKEWHKELMEGAKVSECDECSSILIDDAPIVCCSYSPLECEKCGTAYCDLSC